MKRIDFPRIGESYYEEVLPNGLTIRVSPKPEFAHSYAVFAANYGSIDRVFCLNGQRIETPAGVAHYLEHKMFDMPDGDAMQQFAKLGGSPNAFTSYDMTAYYVDCTENQMENLEVLLRFVSTPYFTQESVDKERGIIAEEVQMYEDSAASKVFENLMEVMYEHHPIRINVAGTVESIAEITPEVLYQCHKAFYDPSNMMLCVVGNYEPEAVAAMAKEILPGEALGVSERFYGEPESVLVSRHRVEQRMEISMPMYLLGYKCEPAEDGGDVMRSEIIGNLAAEILVGESSSLYAKLYEEGVIDADFSADYDTPKGAAILCFGGDGDQYDRIQQEIEAEAARILREGVDTALFHRLKKAMLGRRIRNLDSFDTVSDRQCGYFFAGARYFDFPASFDAVTEEDILAFLARVVKPERAILSLILPKKGEDGTC